MLRTGQGLNFLFRMSRLRLYFLFLIVDFLFLQISIAVCSISKVTFSGSKSCEKNPCLIAHLGRGRGHMALLYGSAIGLCHMALPCGSAIWPCPMALSYGPAIWHCRMTKNIKLCQNGLQKIYFRLSRPPRVSFQFYVDRD